MKLTLLALASAIACTACNRSPPQPAAAPVEPPASASAYSYADERGAAERAVRDMQAAIQRGPLVWPQWSNLAEAQLALAQLSGDYRFYLDAEQSLARAFALAGSGGPYLARARFSFTVHRLDRVDADLLRAERENDPDTAAILGLRADLAFYRGHYPEALRGYRAALARREDLLGLVRLAVWHARMGNLSEAAALFDRGDAIYHGDSPHPRAWLALQRGLLELDRGRWDAALAHYHHALRLLPGWWLAREHIAEIHALRGDDEAAQREYQDIIGDTGNPEFMDAMARLLRHRGDEPAAELWIARARKLYEERLAVLPEASYGHGLDHFLLFGTATEALKLARSNHALRPNGESQIKLVDALLNAGDVGEALRIAQRALASGWNTAALHACAARAMAAAGLVQQAEEQSRIAQTLNPHSARQYGLPEPLRRSAR